MSTSQKFTKKQKKSLAFRERKQSKSKSDLEADIPVAEDQDAIDEVDGRAVDEAEKNSGKGKSIDLVVGKEKKRKRESLGDGESEKDETPQRKKRKPGENAESTGHKVVKQRFILFVGNLKYTTSPEAIKEHFAACKPPPTIRLLTPKSVPSNKSKGCAFLEFSHHNSLQQALKLHQSTLEGRKINIELTVGGGGKGQGRIAKLQGRNRGLQDQRQKKKREKEGTSADDPDSAHPPERSQRYSATSGFGQVPSAKRTWTVENNDEVKATRGGQKHAKKRPKKDKKWGTGVNAIPVG